MKTPLNISKFCDIYSFGKIIYEIIFNVKPFCFKVNKKKKKFLEKLRNNTLINSFANSQFNNN